MFFSSSSSSNNNKKPQEKQQPKKSGTTTAPARPDSKQEKPISKAQQMKQQRQIQHQQQAGVPSADQLNAVSKVKQFKESPHLARVKVEDLLNVEEYHEVAKRKLQKMVYDYYRSGADDQLTLEDTIKAYRNIKLRPRVMVDVSKSKLDLSTTILGDKIDFPIGVAATAMHKMATEQGESATARAAAECGTVYMLSSLSTSTKEEVLKSSPTGLKWYQLYIVKDREFVKTLVANAEKHGFKALVVTVDAPKLGNREADHKNKFQLPEGLSLAILQNALKQDQKKPENVSALNQYFVSQIDDSLTWKDIEWLKSITKLPVVVKGVITEEDAILAVKHGCDGIIVSNHGARQVDTTISTIEALPEVVRAVRSLNAKTEVYIDGGIRRGTDVLKALALGARAVFLGRPVLWGLAVDGENGVKSVLRLLKKELELAMILCGCATVNDVKPSLIFNPPTRPWALSEEERASLMAEPSASLQSKL